MRSTTDVIVRARDLDEAKAFYHRRLGFPIVPVSESIVGFDTGDLTLYFERGEPDGPVFEYLVDDVEKAKVALVAAGCVVVEENPSIPRVYVRDPFGLVFNVSRSYTE